MDRRDRVAIEGAWFNSFNEQTMKATVRYENEDGVEDDIEILCTYEVCGTCEGKGSHVSPGIDAHGITAEEWDRDWDQEDREAYFTGRYDVTCSECRGRRVVPVADERHLTAAMKEALEYGHQMQRGRYEDARTCRMEDGHY